jgi:hypothetical protein
LALLKVVLEKWPLELETVVLFVPSENSHDFFLTRLPFPVRYGKERVVILALDIDQ